MPRAQSAGGGREPVWSPDGTELFYRVQDKMMTVDVMTRPSFSHGTPRELFEGAHESHHSLPADDVHPDGDRFPMVASGSAETQGVHVVLNWSEELKRLVPTEE